jgi:hypothetical protein
MLGRLLSFKPQSMCRMLLRMCPLRGLYAQQMYEMLSEHVPCP